MPSRRSTSGFPVAIEGYDVIDEIGAGGFSVVYRARQSSMNRDVAIKVLNAGFTSDEARRTFERECHALGQLSHHPNIVTVFNDAFTSDGRPCIVMELYHSNYRERLEQSGPLAIDEALEVAVRICGALQTAHEAGVLHRDLKPHNVFVSAYGEPALGDFGISTIDDERSQSRSSGLSIAYAAPEVLEDGGASVASDVYSLGITLYQLVSGTTPFAGPDLASTVRRILTSPPPRIDRAGLPAGLNRIVQDVLAKSPADRPTSMLEFGEQLREVQRRAGLAPTPIPRLAAGRSGGVGTFARPPESTGSGQGWSGGPVATGSVNTSGPSVVSGPGASAARPVGDTARVDANATVARQVVARSAPELRTGSEDALDADRRRRSRRIISVAVAAVAVVAVVLGVALFGGGGGDGESLATSSVPSTTVPPDDFFAVLRPPAELIVAPSVAGGGFTVSYEMPESATEVEVQVVSGGPPGDTYTGTGEPIEIASTEATMCVVARSVNDSGQISTDAGPVCSG
jgi:tRNA A-37 threonylcarbamoyl transferase component Bud32